MVYRRLLAFLLSFALIFSTTSSAYAVSSVGGWTATDSLIAGANTTINATKTAGGKVLNSAVSVAPSAVKVGKHLIKGGGYAALAFAATQLVGDSVDWVLDPANNSIKYKPVSGDTAPDGTGGATGGLGYYFLLSKPNMKFASPYDACNSSNAVASLGYVVATVSKSGDVWNCYDSDKRLLAQAGFKPDADYKPPAVGGVDADGYRHIPIDTVAAKVISNAVAGHAPSQEAVKATALEGFAAGEHDAALDAAATEAGTQNPPDTENPPKDPDAPAEPFDPSSIIAAINALKAMLAGILSSITSLADWFKGEPEGNKPEDNKIDIPDVPLPEPDTDISFGGSCPADLGADFNLYGTNFNFVLMPFSKLCPLLSTFVKPTLILLGSFMAVAIVGGRKDA